MKAQTRAAVDAATRVAAGDDRTSYDGFAIALHWITVILVLLEFFLAETWTGYPRPTRHLMVVAHMSFGIVLSVVVFVRVIWRLIPGHQVAPAVSGAVELASKAVHYLLYAMLVAQAVLGFVLRWGGKEAMSFFGLQIPPLIPPLSHSAHGLVGDAHHWNGWAIIVVAGGHAAAALYHHYVVHDRVLTRMAPWLRRSAG
jgi:cytochrome b561